uniref:Uncharacterized protein n=1 Tax=Ignavibacterium album TaxID=591197 RepID=A0A7V3E8M4_9BACT
MERKKRKFTFNEFFFEATSFISKANDIKKPKMIDYDAILSFLLSAIGIEKILKGILYDINPIFVLKNPNFDVSSKAFYVNQFITQKNIPDLANYETISFSTAIQRAKLFSKTVSSNISLLKKIADTRNVIAHNISADVDRRFIRSFLLSEFKILINDFSKELKFRKDQFFTPLPWEIQKYSEEKEELEKSIKEVMTAKIKEHKIIWEKRKSDKSFFEEKMKLTLKSEKIGESITISCPSCNNLSLLYYKPDVEYSDRQFWVTGFYVTELECFFCDFNVWEYSEIDYLRLNDHLSNLFKDSFSNN